MPRALPPLLPVTSFVLGLLLAACGAPAATASHVRVESENGSITAEVEFDGGVARGDNTVNVRLTAADDGRAAPELLLVDAAMLAHDHRATARAVVLEGDTYRVSGLDLFMAGRWLIALELSQGEKPDRASFAIDVP